MAKTGKKKKAPTVFVPPTIEHTEWSDEGEDGTDRRIPLFSISTPDPDGGEPTVVEYSMPAKPNAGLALGFLRMARLQGGEIAMSWLLEECVGAAGYLALVAEPDISPKVILGIMSRARDVVLGRVEAPKGS